jgi:hypothetical protein
MKGLYKIRKKMRFKRLDTFLIKDTSLMRDPIFWHAGESEMKEKEARERGYRGEVLILSPSINN